MDPVTRLLVPALAGGFAVAWLLVTLNRRSPSRPVAGAPAPGAPAPSQISTDMINMAHIQVVGIGGLGLVAMCAVVALYIPTVGLSLAAGFALGASLAVFLILRRRKSGPMPSSGQRPGANTTLSIDEPAPAADERNPRHSDVHELAAGATPG